MIKKTWITPHKAVGSFGRTFLGGFVVLRLHQGRLSAKAGKVSGSHFWRKPFLLRRKHWKEKNLFISNI